MNYRANYSKVTQLESGRNRTKTHSYLSYYLYYFHGISLPPFSPGKAFMIIQHNLTYTHILLCWYMFCLLVFCLLRVRLHWK